MRKRNYVNNVDLTNALVVWKQEGAEPPVPDYIATCFLQIVTRYGSKRNFSGYTYLEDMKSEALEHCIRYADRFKIEKSDNAFAYFTQITHNAFIQFINKEKKLSNFKFNLVRDSVENAHKLDWNSISSATDPELRNKS